MKKLLFILAVLISQIAKSQTIVPRSPASIIPVDQNLIVHRYFKIPVFADTAAANTAITGHDSIGIVFQRYSTGQFYIRDTSTGTHKWTVLASGGSSGVWGSITGTIGSQADLTAALAAKQNIITTGTAAQYITGTLGLATFPTNVSSFTNDAGYITSVPTILDTMSVTGAAVSGNRLRLVNDAVSPGAKYHYGTDGGGTKGWIPDTVYTPGVTSLTALAPLTGGVITTTGSIGADTAVLATKTDLLGAVGLTATYIGYGNGSNHLTGVSTLTYNGTDKITFNGSGLRLVSGSTGSMYFGGAPSTQANGQNTIIGRNSWNASNANTPTKTVGVGDYNFTSSSYSGNSNTAVGSQALQVATTAVNNTGVGGAALAAVTTGSYNTGIGSQSGTGLTTGLYNTYIGYSSGTSAVSTNYNIGIGYATLPGNGGTDNIGVGVNAGSHYNVAAQNITIGNDSSSGSTLNVNNFMFIGHGYTETNYRTNSATFGRNDQVIRLGNGGGNTAKMNSLVTPAASDMYYNTDSLAYCYYNGTAWIKWGTGSGGGGGSDSAVLAGSGLIKSVVGTAITLKADTSLLATKNYVGTYSDTLRIGHTGTSTIWGGYPSPGFDSLYLKSFVAGSNITISTQSDSTILISSTGGGGTVADSVQVYSSGTTLTQSTLANIIQLNPASVQSTLTITTATSANWAASNDLIIVAGGTVTSGNPVITTLAIAAGSGLTLVQAVTPTTINAGEAIRYHRIGTLIYRIN